MATRVRPTNVRMSGAFIAGGPQKLEYVVLENDTVWVSLKSIYGYLEIGQDSNMLKKNIVPSNLGTFYSAESSEENFGISCAQIPALCINIIELNAKTGEYKNESINAMMLLMFFSSLSISHLINLDCLAKTNAGDLTLKVSWLK